MSLVHIDRCYCFSQSFAALARLAEEAGAASVPALQRAAEAEGQPFGLKCRLCHPYVRRMLRTGQTDFDQIVTDEEEPPQTVGDALRR